MPTDEELMVFTAAKGDLVALEEIVQRLKYSAWNIVYRFLSLIILDGFMLSVRHHPFYTLRIFCD